MGRAIITRTGLAAAHNPAAAAPGASAPSPDGYVERLTKLIPTEILTAYAAAVPSITSDTVQIVVFIVGLAATVGFLGLLPVKVNGTTIKTTPAHYVISLIAFTVWAVAMNPQLAHLFHLAGTTVNLLAILVGVVLALLSPSAIEP